MRSGAMYSSDPMNAPVAVSVVSAWWIAMPKSVRTASPSPVSSTLAGFTSRWTIPTRCAVSSASSRPAATRAAAATGRGPDSAIRSCSECPSTSCMTIQGRPSSTTTSCTLTMFGWSRSRAALRASRVARAIRSVSSAAGGRISLTATSSPRAVSWAFQTSPNPPRPSVPISRYRPPTNRSGASGAPVTPANLPTPSTLVQDCSSAVAAGLPARLGPHRPMLLLAPM